MRKAIIALALLALLAADESTGDPFERGVLLFEQGRYADAVKEFAKAEELAPDDLLARYNGLTSLAAGGDLQRALAKLGVDFESLDVRPDVRAGAAYNLGTAFLGLADEADRAGNLASRAGELMQSVNWLRRSLLDAPGDTPARNNLEYADKLLKKLRQQQQEQQQQEGEGQQDKDKEQQQDQQQRGEDKNEQQQQQGEGEQDKKQQQEGEQKQDQQRQPQEGEQQQGKQREIPPDVARNLLKAARDAEIKAMKMLREHQNKDSKKQSSNKRDW